MLENEVAAPQVLINIKTMRLRITSHDMLAQKRMHRIMSSKEERKQHCLARSASGLI
jgi:hypothetical protein